MNILVKDRGVEFYVRESYPLADLRRVQQRSLEMYREISAIFDRNQITYTLGYGSLLGAARHEGYIPWDDDIDLFIPAADYAKAILALRRGLPRDIILHDKRNDPVYWITWVKARDVYSGGEESLWKIDRKLRFHGICVDLIRVDTTVSGSFRRTELTKSLKEERKSLEVGSSDPTSPGKLSYSRHFAQKAWLRGRIAVAARLSKLDRTKLVVAAPGTIIEASFRHDDFFPIKTGELQFEGMAVNAPHNVDGVLSAIYGDYREMPPLELRIPHFEYVEFFERNPRS